MFYCWIFAVFLAIIMVFKKDNSRGKKMAPSILIGLVITILSIVISATIWLTNLRDEVRCSKNERDMHDTINRLRALLPIPTKYVHVTDVQHKFFKKGEIIYMGWLYKPECYNVFGGLTLDTTAWGDSIPINGKNCKHGLGMFAQPHHIASAIYTLEKRCSEFKADIVLIINKERIYGKDTIESFSNKMLSKNGRGVIFRIYGDDNHVPMYEDSITACNKPKHISINIDNVNRLKLEVQSIELGYWAQNSCWANARVIVK